MGLKLLTRFRLGLSHLSEHRFNHNFQSCINPLCSCSLATESTTHFLLHCHHFSTIRSTLLNSTNEVLGSITNISDLSDCALVKKYYYLEIKIILKGKTHIQLMLLLSIW